MVNLQRLGIAAIVIVGLAGLAFKFYSPPSKDKDWNVYWAKLGYQVQGLQCTEDICDAQSISHETDAYKIQLHGLKIQFKAQLMIQINVLQFDIKDKLGLDITISQLLHEALVLPTEGFSAEQVLIENFFIGASTIFKKVLVSNLIADPRANLISFSNLKVSEGPVTVDADKSYVQLNKNISDGLHVTTSARILLKPNLYPDIIRKPIDLKIEGTYSSLNPWNLVAEGFGKRMSLHFSKTFFQLNTDGINIDEYFKTSLPVALSTQFWGEPLNLNHWDGKGKISLRGKEFLMTSPFVFQRNTKDSKFLMTPIAANNMEYQLFRIFRGEASILNFMAAPNGALHENISRLYFQKPYLRLNRIERNIVALDLKYFLK